MKTRTTVENSSTIRNIKLDLKTMNLHAEEVRTISSVTRSLHYKTHKPYQVLSRQRISEEVEESNFHLEEISEKKLKKLRKEEKPSFVLKMAGKYFHTEVPKNISFISADILGDHQCAVYGNGCKHLLALPEKEGGCKKVLDRWKRLEKYPWITIGYETFSTNHDVFVVVQCEHYCKA